MKHRQSIWSCCWLLWFMGMMPPPLAANPVAFSEGEILLRQTAGEQTTEWRFTKSAKTLRIEQLTESRPPAPVNLIDLETGDITIIAPINRSVRTFPAAAFERKEPRETVAGQEVEWEIPPGVGANPSPPGVGATDPRQGTAPFPGGAGLPASPAIPGMPTIPEMPGGIPAFPDLPDQGPVGELVAHDDVREIHGHSCRFHTMRLDGQQELALWLATHPDLPPFALPVSDAPSPYGSRDLMQEWPAIIRRSGQFPMIVELRQLPERRFGPPSDEEENADAGPRVLATWEVVSIKPMQPDPAVFGIPEGYFEERIRE